MAYTNHVFSHVLSFCLFVLLLLFFRLPHATFTAHHHYMMGSILFAWTFIPPTVYLCDETFIRDVQFVKLTLYSSPLASSEEKKNTPISTTTYTPHKYICTKILSTFEMSQRTQRSDNDNKKKTRNKVCLIGNF